MKERFATRQGVEGPEFPLMGVASRRRDDDRQSEEKTEKGGFPNLATRWESELPGGLASVTLNRAGASGSRMGGLGHSF